jgi:hypothetical protein
MREKKNEENRKNKEEICSEEVKNKDVDMIRKRNYERKYKNKSK